MAKSDNYLASRIRYVTDTIASGTDSAVLALNGRWLLRVILPASFASTTMTIAESPTSDGTFTIVYDLGANKSWTIAASKSVNVPDLHIMANFIKVTFGTSETAMTVTYVLAQVYNV
jgi:hypothetical protein